MKKSPYIINRVIPLDDDCFDVLNSLCVDEPWEEYFLPGMFSQQQYDTAIAKLMLFCDVQDKDRLIIGAVTVGVLFLRPDSFGSDLDELNRSADFNELEDGRYLWSVLKTWETNEVQMVQVGEMNEKEFERVCSSTVIRTAALFGLPFVTPTPEDYLREMKAKTFLRRALNTEMNTPAGEKAAAKLRFQYGV